MFVDRNEHEYFKYRQTVVVVVVVVVRVIRVVRVVRVVLVYSQRSFFISDSFSSL